MPRKSSLSTGSCCTHVCMCTYKQTFNTVASVLQQHAPQTSVFTETEESTFNLSPLLLFTLVPLPLGRGGKTPVARVPLPSPFRPVEKIITPQSRTVYARGPRVYACIGVYAAFLHVRGNRRRWQPFLHRGLRIFDGARTGSTTRLSSLADCFAGLMKA